ncbi:MAG: hypothetical protein IJC51_03860 [Eggerthellaceae bacterium]|nr:hypothetical protein [Eggerthellaceae bacterium]
MKSKSKMRLLACLCACALALVAMAGCAQQNTSEQNAQAANRQYMTDVNRCMDQLSDSLDAFSDAVSRNDIVSMRTQADSAFRSLDELAALEAPEVLLDVQVEYVEGCAKLEQALGDYLTLFTQIETATEEQPFDFSTYDQSLKDIQKLYNEGIAQLESGDALAAEKE